MQVPQAIVDLLNSLLEAEQDSIFRFMEEGSPYLTRADVDVRKPIHYIAKADQRRAGELWEMIEQLGGEPCPRGLQPQEQFLAYLSIKFILPKLVEAKQLCLKRYENAVNSLGGDSSPAAELLRRHLAEHLAEMRMLLEAAEAVAKG